MNSEKIWKIWKKPAAAAAAAAAIYPRAAVAAAATAIYPRAAAAAAAATRLLENPVEATTIVQKFVLLLVEHVV